ncbi:MAG: hypothetical protein NC548_27240 [Lachnospiraceae bacterium]|nr:hypothetical protein [Lachnospiraceae bacterium]
MKKLKDILLVLSIILFGPIGLLFVFLWRREWLKNCAALLAICSWSIFYVVAAFYNPEGTISSTSSTITAETASSKVASDEEGSTNESIAEVIKEDSSSKMEIAPVETPAATESPAVVSTTPAQVTQPTQEPTYTAPIEPEEPTPEPTHEPHIVEGYCKDGTPVRGDPTLPGKANACYGHKGWRDEY